MTDSPPRKRGRPFGSKDSYQRQRARTKKRPPQTTLDLVMPPIYRLISAAEIKGIAIGAGRSYHRTQEEVERATTILLAAIAEALDNEKRY